MNKSVCYHGNLLVTYCYCWVILKLGTYLVFKDNTSRFWSFVLSTWLHWPLARCIVTWHKCMVFIMILHCKDILSQGQSGLMRWTFGTNHAPGAETITRPVDLQSSSLPVCYDCPVTHHKSLVNEILWNEQNGRAREVDRWKERRREGEKQMKKEEARQMRRDSAGQGQGQGHKNHIGQAWLKPSDFYAYNLSLFYLSYSGFELTGAEFGGHGRLGPPGPDLDTHKKGQVKQRTILCCIPIKRWFIIL